MNLMKKKKFQKIPKKNQLSLQLLLLQHNYYYNYYKQNKIEYESARERGNLREEGGKRDNF